jgi:hypothetical protein
VGMKSLRLCLAFFLVFTSINILKKKEKPFHYLLA